MPWAKIGLPLVAVLGLVSQAAAQQASDAPPMLTAPNSRLAEADCAPVSAPRVPGLELKFASGFEEGVTLSHRLGGRQSSLSGADRGFNWDRLPHTFLYVSVAATYRGLVSTELREDRAHTGKRSLYMAQNVVNGDAQNRLQFYGSDDEFGHEIITRRWYYFPDYNKMLNAEFDDTSVAGTREFGVDGKQDFSIPLYIIRNKRKLLWRVAGVDYDAGKLWSQWTKRPRGFIVDNLHAPVPIGKWFHLEIYVKRHPTDGIVQVWLDGCQIFDIKGVRTKGPGSKWFTKIADYDGTKPGHLWVDDVEVYGR